MSTVYLSAAAPGGRAVTMRSRATVPLCAAGLCVIALALTWVVAALIPQTHFKDAVALHDLTLLGDPRRDDVASTLLHLLDPLFYTLWGLLLVGVALVRRRPRLALAVALALGLAPLTAEILKPLMAHPHAWVDGEWVRSASWPSGHASAATVLALCAVLVVPSRLRLGVAVAGAIFVAAVGFSLLLLAWHLPSDVLGGYLVGALWAALALAGVRASDARSAARARDAYWVSHTLGR